jgi:hypothetical protein
MLYFSLGTFAGDIRALIGNFDFGRRQKAPPKHEGDDP